jgi:hypothetical protein
MQLAAMSVARARRNVSCICWLPLHSFSTLTSNFLFFSVNSFPLPVYMWYLMSRIQSQHTQHSVLSAFTYYLLLKPLNVRACVCLCTRMLIYIIVAPTSSCPAIQPIVSIPHTAPDLPSLLQGFFPALWVTHFNLCYGVCVMWMYVHTVDWYHWVLINVYVCRSPRTLISCWILRLWWQWLLLQDSFHKFIFCWKCSTQPGAALIWFLLQLIWLCHSYFTCGTYFYAK